MKKSFVIFLAIFYIFTYFGQGNASTNVGFVTGTMHCGFFDESKPSSDALNIVGRFLDFISFILSIIFIFGHHHGLYFGGILLTSSIVFGILDVFYESLSTFWIIIWRSEMLFLWIAIGISVENFSKHPYLTSITWAMFTLSFAWLFYEAFWKKEYFMLRGSEKYNNFCKEDKISSVNVNWPASGSKAQIMDSWIYVVTRTLFNGPLWIFFLYYLSIHVTSKHLSTK